MGLRHRPHPYGRQEWGILCNGRKPDTATPCERRSPLGCKALSAGTKKMTVPAEEASANYVPAAAVRRRMRALSGFIGRKEFVGGSLSLMLKIRAQPWECIGYWRAGVW